MSKVLKFIVHFIVICTILCVLALALPPFFGVETVIMDSSDKATNLPMGSVTYAIPVKTDTVTVGTPILVQEDSKTYRYNLVNVNPETNTGTVIDPSTSSEEGITVSVHNWVPKVVVTIGWIGYLLIATESLEGMIILGLAILFLIILYVIAELWKKEPEDEYEDASGETKHVKTEKELKAEEKAREKRMNKEDREMLKLKKKEEKKAKENRKKIRTGGFVDEIYEDDEDDSEEVQPQVSAQAAATEAHEVLKKEIAAATAEDTSSLQTTPAKDEDLEEFEKELMALDDDDDEDNVSDTKEINLKSEDMDKDEAESDDEDKTEAEEPAQAGDEAGIKEDDKETDEKSASGEEPEKPEESEVRRLAIPRYTASQLQAKARKAGDAPDIVRDSITKVTLFDYSDIIGSDVASEEEE